MTEHDVESLGYRIVSGEHDGRFLAGISQSGAEGFLCSAVSTLDEGHARSAAVGKFAGIMAELDRLDAYIVLTPRQEH
ncbi:MAG: hypothetical protein IT434_12690 [Phycisphaerales bacterium]|jgi:hypothetical protein|nr:hypothetical protein [Phycisphaerales bacterium]